MRILYIDIDTQRADHLGCYGYFRNTSPNIDRIAARSMQFNNVHASDTPCLPSRTALLTGRFGIHNGVVNHGGTDVDNGFPWVVPGLHRTGTLTHLRTELGPECLREPEGAVPVLAQAGDIVMFSSLTPHRTGPNLTNEVRKSYILQYAPDGAAVYRDGHDEPTVQDDPERQYMVVSD
jgi:hypothetical protein